MRNMYDLSNHAAHSMSGGEGWNISMNAATGQALNNVNSLTQKFAKDHHLSFTDAQRVLSAAYIEGKVGANVGIGVSAGASLGGRQEKDHSDGIDNRGTYAAAKDFVMNSGYSNSVDTVQRAVHDHSLRTNDENGKRLLDGTSASLDRAETARNEMTQSYQSAQSYRAIASRSQDESSNINSNLSQVFKEWMMHQPGTNGHGKMSVNAVENIMANHPEIAASYAQRFSEDYVKNVATDWNKDISTSSKNIHQSYEAGIKKSNDEYRVQSNYDKNQTIIEEKARKTGLNQTKKLDESVKLETNQLIQANQNKLSESKNTIDQQGHDIQEQIKNQGVTV
jgi:hypothetical protein